MKHSFSIICCCLQLTLILPLAYAGDVNSGNIEIYVDGQKFTSLDTYNLKKRQDKLDLVQAEAFARENSLKLSQSKSKPELQDVDLEPFMGKTVTIQPDGTTITSQSTLEIGKTIEIKPAGRVAGVQPSFQQIGEDFDAGKRNNDIQPKQFANAKELIDDMRRKSRAQDKPLLILNNGQKVKIMELEDAPSSESTDASNAPAIKP